MTSTRKSQGGKVGGKAAAAIQRARVDTRAKVRRAITAEIAAGKRPTVTGTDTVALVAQAMAAGYPVTQCAPGAAVGRTFHPFGKRGESLL